VQNLDTLVPLVYCVGNMLLYLLAGIQWVLMAGTHLHEIDTQILKDLYPWVIQIVGHGTHRYSHGYTCEYPPLTRTHAQPYTGFAGVTNCQPVLVPVTAHDLNPYGFVNP